MSLPDDLISQVRELLLPHMGTVDEREAYLTEAFWSDDNPLYKRIALEGAATVFAIRCTRYLLEHGCLPNGKHALARLLEVIRTLYGTDKHSRIDALRAQLNVRCAEAAPRTAQPTPPVPVATPAPTLGIQTPTEGRPSTVFISYSHSDDAFAQRLIADLQRHGHACWLDQVSLKGGDDWVRSITEGINNSYAFVSVVSAAANASQWVRREFLWAEAKRKPIIPVLAEDCELVIYLTDLQILRLHDDYAAGLAALLGALSVLTPPSMLPSTAADTAAAAELLRPAAPNRRALELDYLDWLSANVLFDLEKYTPLGGESHFTVAVRRGQPFRLAVMRPEFEHIAAHEAAHTETRRFENAVEELLQIRRAVLLGEPGAGKTTTLLGIAGSLAAQARQDPSAPLPIFVRLGRWTQPDQPLEAFIAAELGRLGAYLPDLLRDGRLVPLLDGMNEIPTDQRAAKYPQLAAFIKQRPEWIALTSCRAADYTLDLGLDRVTVTPLDPLRIREFAIRYLGAADGAALFGQIVGAAALRFEARFRELFAHRLPNWEQVFWLHERLPEAVDWRGEFVNTFYYSWKEWRAVRDLVGSLLQLARNPYMLSMLTQVYAERQHLPANRGQLFRSFVEALLLREKLAERDAEGAGIRLSAEGETLLGRLTDLAYAMQRRRAAAASDEEGAALTVLALAEVEALLDARQRYLATSTNLLEIGETVRFSHQLLQEYFAARHMGEAIQRGDLHAEALWTPAAWWQRTNWEEATILLAGMESDDCTPTLDWVATANPEVAALCLTRSGAQVPAATLSGLKALWLPRLNPAHEPDPRGRAAVGRALGLPRLDPRPGVLDFNWEDAYWCKVQAGEFQMGAENERDNPPRTETIEYDYWIGKYQITYAQFQLFLDDPDGFRNPEWWAGLAADEAHRAQSGDQAFKVWNHPRERISWYDCMAFCAWLDAQREAGKVRLPAFIPSGYSIRLPTEQEWEKAARGTDGREYPWGNGYQVGFANIDESRLEGGTYLGQTSAVGIYPQGASPCGALDMSGNVWEWCLTEYSSGQVNRGSNAWRALRGGSWNINRGYARAVSRSLNFPVDRSDAFGVRLVAGVVLPSQSA